MTAHARLAASPADVTASTKTLDAVVTSWERSLRARNRSPRTIRSYLDAAQLLLAFLSENCLPTTVAAILPEHLEMFIDDQLKRWRPATAANRYPSNSSLAGSFHKARLSSHRSLGCVHRGFRSSLCPFLATKTSGSF